MRFYRLAEGDLRFTATVPIAGEMTPLITPVRRLKSTWIQSAFFKLGKLHHAVLLTDAAQDPQYAEKGCSTFERLKAEFEAIRTTLPAGETKDLYDEVSSSLKDFGDEFKDLPRSYQRRIEKLHELDRLGQAIHQAITPVLDRGMETTLETVDKPISTAMVWLNDWRCSHGSFR